MSRVTQPFECCRCGRVYRHLQHCRALADGTDVCRWCITDDDAIHPEALSDGLTPDPAPPGPRPRPDSGLCERGLD
jgi:hypothetical protein